MSWVVRKRQGAAVDFYLEEVRVQNKHSRAKDTPTASTGGADTCTTASLHTNVGIKSGSLDAQDVDVDDALESGYQSRIKVKLGVEGAKLSSAFPLTQYFESNPTNFVKANNLIQFLELVEEKGTYWLDEKEIPRDLRFKERCIREEDILVVYGQIHTNVNGEKELRMPHLGFQTGTISLWPVPLFGLSVTGFIASLLKPDRKPKQVEQGKREVDLSMSRPKNSSTRPDVIEREVDKYTEPRSAAEATKPSYDVSAVGEYEIFVSVQGNSTIANGAQTCKSQARDSKGGDKEPPVEQISVLEDTTENSSLDSINLSPLPPYLFPPVAYSSTFYSIVFSLTVAAFVLFVIGSLLCTINFLYGVPVILVGLAIPTWTYILNSYDSSLANYIQKIYQTQGLSSFESLKDGQMALLVGRVCRARTFLKGPISENDRCVFYEAVLEGFQDDVTERALNEARKKRSQLRPEAEQATALNKERVTQA